MFLLDICLYIIFLKEEVLFGRCDCVTTSIAPKILFFSTISECGNTPYPKLFKVVFPRLCVKEEFIM